MVPTLVGRIQTRVFLLALVGALVTLAVTPVLPVSGSLADRYRTTFIVLAAVLVLGIGWEVVYHTLMQWRWEKDWPTLFGLITLVPEGIVIGLLARDGNLPGLPGSVPLDAFALHFSLVWLVVWLVANGPMRTTFIRWRFRGGRLI